MSIGGSVHDGYLILKSTLPWLSNHGKGSLGPELQDCDHRHIRTYYEHYQDPRQAGKDAFNYPREESILCSERIRPQVL